MSEDGGTCVSAVAKSELPNRYKDSGREQGESPVSNPQRCSVEIGVEWAVDDKDDTQKRKCHRSPQPPVMKLVARKEALSTATLQYVGKLYEDDGKICHGHARHMNLA